jgi:hypothetical protein
VLGEWFAAFVFTQAIEVPIYCRALAGRADPRSGEPLPREPLAWRAGMAFLASMATHPYVWFVIPSLFWSAWWTSATAAWPALGEWRYALFLVVAEGFAVAAEALLLRGLRVRRALWWALLANAASAGLGMLTRELLGWP